MKPFYFFLVLFSICWIPLSAQDYLPVPFDRSSFYDTDRIRMDEYGNSWFNAHCHHNCLTGIRIDSVVSLPGEDIYHFVKQEREGQGYWCESDSWWGDYLTWQNDGTQIFHNGQYDSIFFKPYEPLGAQWNLYQVDDSTYFRAAIDSVYEGLILGIPDSIKQISIVRVNDNGDELPHDFNHLIFLISKKSGFAKTYNLYHFPQDTVVKVLAGMDNPDLGLTGTTAQEVFDFDIGDEFHYIYNASDFASSWRRVYKSYLVLDKTAPNPQDSVSYSMKRTLYEIYHVFDQQIADTTFIIDTIESQYVFNSFYWNYFDELPFERERDQVVPNGFNKLWYDEDRVYVQTLNYFANNDDCFMEYVGIGVSPFFSYSEGLGLFCFENNSEPSEFWEKLVYYNKSGEIWGESIDFDELTPIKEAFLPDYILNIFPNPAKQKLHITAESLAGQILNLELINTSGKQIISNEFRFEGNYTLNLPEQLKGLFFMKITTISGQSISKKVFVD